MTKREDGYSTVNLLVTETLRRRSSGIILLRNDLYNDTVLGAIPFYTEEFKCTVSGSWVTST